MPGQCMLRMRNAYFLRRGPFAATDEFLEFRVVVQAIEVGIVGRPILVAPSGSKRLLERFEGLCFFPQDPEGAGGIVECARIAGSQSDGRLQVSNALIRVLLEVGKVRS